MRGAACENCNRFNCHGECENYILEMIEHDAERNCFDRLFKEIPKFNYVLNEKISAIFGTDLEVVNKDKVLSDKNTKSFEQFLYSKNENRVTNLHEIKRAVKDKEIFGESYLFYDTNNLYFLRKSDVSVYRPANSNPIMDDILFYIVGEVDLPDKLTFPKEGFIKQDAGYIIHPDNMIKLTSDTYVLNSDLRQLQILLEINKKIYDSTTKRDFGDVYFFTNDPTEGMVSATQARIKDAEENLIKKTYKGFLKKIKDGKSDDNKISALSSKITKVQQVAPITKVTDYKFIWESQDDIITSVLNFPKLLAGLGDDAGNVSKDELLKEARANTLTPIKSDVANALSDIAKKMFGDEYYLRFQDYNEVNADYDEDAKDTKEQ